MLPESPHGPDFLVIGAQKSGTTTLWEDLRTHPELGLSDKESNGLLDPAVTSQAGRRRYGALFPSKGGPLRGEVCTTYTMLPENPNVVARAQALNPDLRVIYIVREPLSRVVSHHHHDFGLGLCGPDIDIEVQRHAPLVDNTRYATQVAPWIEAFGRERVQVIKFEDFVSDREATLTAIHDFLEIRHDGRPKTVVHNASEGKRVAIGKWATISDSTIYRQLVRPLLPEGLRRHLMSVVLPLGPERPSPPSNSTLDYLMATLEPEVQELADMMREAPLWDLHKCLATRRSEP